MSKRNYNVFFNTHTVSGIVISVALYVIFFAGAFALFKDEIAIWEEGKPIGHIQRHQIDYDKIFEHLDKEYELSGRDLQINFGGTEDKIYVFMGASKDSLASEKGKTSQYFSLDINSNEKQTYPQYYSLGEFMYRLHFFAQLPSLGIYLAGFVSLFFLFAIVTGVIVHWKKIISNFYVFDPKVVLRRVWTDAHTALGFLGLPFQFIFAVTGAYFCLSVLVLIPANMLYNGDQEKLIEDVLPERKTYAWETTSNERIPSFNEFANQTVTKWENFYLTRSFISNYGGTNMRYTLSGELKDSERFIGTGRIVYDAYKGTIASVKDPNISDYNENVSRVLGRLHYADFGGIFMKITYFILAWITCFVIITGVLIWIESRNKKAMTLSERLYTAKVGHIYLAICLPMLPVTALAFLFVKIFNGYFIEKQTAIYYFYFLCWLTAIFFFRFKRNNYFTNKYSLLLGAILGLLVPIVNGVFSGNWIWVAYMQQQYEIVTIDMLWLGISILSFIFYKKIKPDIKSRSAFSKDPIDYKNIAELKAQESAKLIENNTLSNQLSITENKNHIPMRTKIIILWILLAIFWVIHHLYGLFNIYYNETLVMEGATGEAPMIHHIYRILFEGICLLFGLLTIELEKKWFKIVSLFWASIAGLYNIYHFIEAILYESGNVSEIFMLLLAVIASIFLVINLNKWRK